MRVLCCESCSSGQRLAAPTEREREREKKKGNGGERKRDERTKVTVEHRGMRGRAAGPTLECHAQGSGLLVFLCVCVYVCVLG